RCLHGVVADAALGRYSARHALTPTNATGTSLAERVPDDPRPWWMLFMTINVPQSILDELTDVDMPKLVNEKASTETISVGGVAMPVYRYGCVIVGSGAAGLRAAVELKRRGDDVAVVSQSAWGGTSACSGSDKQTLHTANTSDHGDDYRA